MNCLPDIMNAFDLVVICGAIPIIKVNLPRQEEDFMAINIRVNESVTSGVVCGLRCYSEKNTMGGIIFLFS